MKFVDLRKQYLQYQTEIDTAIAGVIETTSFINGPAVKNLEGELSKFVGGSHSIGCSSGTDALIIAMMALDVKPGDEIIIPAFTFIATGETISFLGAKPVFCDVDPITYNLDPVKIQGKITDKTKGIIPVSLYGQCADFDVINDIAEKNNLWVIEDGAQSFGGEYKERKSCSVTDIATTSFFPAKPLGCFGDGGAVFTSDSSLASKMRMILNHGQEKRYHHKYIGINGRLDSIQAAVLSVKLKHFQKEIESRNKIAGLYSSYLEGIVGLPSVLDHNKSTWAQYTIMVDKRDELREYLASKDIPTAVHYPLPLYSQEAFKYLWENPENFPVSEALSQKVVSLPMHSFLDETEIEMVSLSIKEFYNG